MTARTSNLPIYGGTKTPVPKPPIQNVDSNEPPSYTPTQTSSVTPVGVKAITAQPGVLLQSPPKGKIRRTF